VTPSRAGYCQVTTTLPSRQAAEALAGSVVEERLAACAQVVGPVASTYRWQGSVERAEEWYCHLKTTVERFPALHRRIRELHPYQLPEVIATPITEADADYLHWIASSVTPA
jgi:periplasmic divalent cation tolerance protein